MKNVVADLKRTRSGSSDMAELNLTDTIAWICLLKYKNALSRMVSGEVIDVLTSDPETAENLCKLIDRSGDEIVVNAEEEGCFRIRVKKGAATG